MSLLKRCVTFEAVGLKKRCEAVGESANYVYVTCETPCGYVEEICCL